MNIGYLLMPAVSMVLSGNALADDGAALARKNNCMECHSLSGKSIGPALQDIAAKYRNNKNAQTMLERKVRSGGAGIWGKMPMPASANSVSDDDIRNIVKWVLALK